MHTAFHLYNLIVGLIAAAGLLYMLYVHRIHARYRLFVFVTTSGILVFTVAAPVVELIYPRLVHAIHGVAAVLIVFGLYNPVRNDLRKDQWAELILQDPTTLRRPSKWMVPMDDKILELFHSSELVLTPAIIAHNIDYSREEVNRRLGKLEEGNLVERIERGKYCITDLGEEYLQGRLHVRMLEDEYDS